MMEFLTAPNPIRTVLIANRGEIACRIMRTCHRLGLRTVAIHSKVDSEALHVQLASTSVCIGPAASSESYLKIPAVIEAAKASGADAVHPGYGFLSENADFVKACDEAGLLFIGPSAHAVAEMGSKIQARRIAKKAGVPTVPGFEGVNASYEELSEAAVKLGYPVMIKANSGGGGRGMRRVTCADALKAAIDSARQEAGASFGDDSVFIEKLIESTRHLEVQVFGDGRGGALHFYERDCSVQRNHQKVIEEAPAPNLPEVVREKLLESALKLTSAIKYAGVGTVEFIMEASGDSPYFLEMNTRLQVEHPVTEEICGVDLVEFQLRLAAGLSLPLTQEQIVPKGHSIEVRINAERPESAFIPGTGTFLDVDGPAGLRFETGVATGSAVGTNYDSMMAKLISYGPDRESARRQLVGGLKSLSMIGVPTNQAFLIDCLEAKAFADGRGTTDFLTETFPDGWLPDADELTRLRGAAARAFCETGEADPRQRRDWFRTVKSRRGARADFVVQDDFGNAELTLWTGGRNAVEADGKSLDMTDVEATVFEAPDALYAMRNGLTIAANIMIASDAKLGGAGVGLAEGDIAAQLTGLVTKVFVTEGEEVEAGTPLLEMEAMKLVHTLTAPFGGKVTNVSCTDGATVQVKTVLMSIEGEE
ncbi:biotin carboxylase N-terminal domain-containing protein [Marinobacter sp. ATCH36]|uniref:acetyl/propionyl/methylcrotonyl-CoA carboxylase subunit alpha n=1 Tax=Marinobacter sp. ATCH36 TaxID=2945106 RepID=UPI0020220A27|nr:biotin carboxylase N-terminal domain-containing protein [Marinobacter sp. ATCH36]MCL7946167.1 ATP-grasp domain-containing protein [Marinobacter sp. ATCH36]